VDLVEDRERQHLADAGHGAQPVEGMGIVALGFPDDRELEVENQRVVLLDQSQVDFDALSNRTNRTINHDELRT
jgi:hypothetical protein